MALNKAAVIQLAAYWDGSVAVCTTDRRRCGVEELPATWAWEEAGEGVGPWAWRSAGCRSGPARKAGEGRTRRKSQNRTRTDTHTEHWTEQEMRK